MRFGIVPGVTGTTIAIAVYGLSQHGLKKCCVRRYLHIPWVPGPNSLISLALVGLLGLFLRWFGEAASFSGSYAWVIIAFPFSARSFAAAMAIGILTRKALENGLNETLSVVCGDKKR